MFRVLIYDGNASRRGELRAAVNSVLSELGSRNHGLMRAATLKELADVTGRARPDYFDFIVCRIEFCAVEAKEALQKARLQSPDAGLIIIADGSECASHAFAIGANGFCLESEGVEGLRRAITPSALRAIEARRYDAVGLRSDAGVGNVVLDGIMFVESSKKGSLIHLATGETLLVRMTLQTLYDHLAANKSFVKAGSSFIVNMDNVLMAGEGAVVFANGESIVVPVRVRKPFKEAFESSWQRAEMPYTGSAEISEPGGASADAALGAACKA